MKNLVNLSDTKVVKHRDTVYIYTIINGTYYTVLYFNIYILLMS